LKISILMTLKRAIQILEQHNEWRRGENEDLKMQNPTNLGTAIDVVVDYYNNHL